MRGPPATSARLGASSTVRSRRFFRPGTRRAPGAGRQLAGARLNARPPGFRPGRRQSVCWVCGARNVSSGDPAARLENECSARAERKEDLLWQSRSPGVGPGFGALSLGPVTFCVVLRLPCARREGRSLNRAPLSPPGKLGFSSCFALGKVSFRGDRSGSPDALQRTSQAGFLPGRHCSPIAGPPTPRQQFSRLTFCIAKK